jgi:hypothetical protein
MVHQTAQEAVMSAIAAVSDMATGRGTGTVPGEEASPAPSFASAG